MKVLFSDLNILRARDVPTILSNCNGSATSSDQNNGEENFSQANRSFGSLCVGFRRATYHDTVPAVTVSNQDNGEKNFSQANRGRKREFRMSVRYLQKRILSWHSSLRRLFLYGVAR